MHIFGRSVSMKCRVRDLLQSIFLTDIECATVIDVQSSLYRLGTILEVQVDARVVYERVDWAMSADELAESFNAILRPNVEWCVDNLMTPFIGIQ